MPNGRMPTWEWMTDNRRTALRAICDTVVPSIARTDDATGFWARKSTDVGTDQAIIGVLATMPAEQRDGLLGLVDVLGAQGIVHASQLSREQLLHAPRCSARRRPPASARSPA